MTRRRKEEKKLFDTVQDTVSAGESTSAYGIGKTYTLTVNLYVRDAANGKKKKLSGLTADGQKHAYADHVGDAILKKATRVTVKAMQAGSVLQTVRQNGVLPVQSAPVLSKHGTDRDHGEC